MITTMAEAAVDRLLGTVRESALDDRVGAIANDDALRWSE